MLNANLSYLAAQNICAAANMTVLPPAVPISTNGRSVFNNLTFLSSNALHTFVTRSSNDRSPLSEEPPEHELYPSLYPLINSLVWKRGPFSGWLMYLSFTSEIPASSQPWSRPDSYGDLPPAFASTPTTENNQMVILI